MPSNALLFVFIGGGAGSLLRYLIAYRFTLSEAGSTSPWATLLVNCVGCFLIGIFGMWFSQVTWESQQLRLLLLTGFLGGFTTYSAFSFETVQLLNEGFLLLAFEYVLASLLLGLLLTILGAGVARIILA